MIQKVTRGKIGGTIKAPASKSFSQRALAAALFADGQTTLTSLGLCNDTEAVMAVIEQLGATVRLEGDICYIEGGFSAGGDLTVSVGESGLATRLFSPIVSLLDSEVTITGHGSLLARPMTIVEEPLMALGAAVQSRQGLLPLRIKGAIKGAEITVDASLSSQFLSGLLLALPVAEGDSVINVTVLNSKPYIDMTLDTLKAFGIEVVNENYERFLIKGGQRYRATTYNIEGDWSGASALLVAGATAGGAITIENLNSDSPQADRAIIDALVASGAKVSITGDSITVEKSELKGFAFDATDCPDLFPALAVLAAHAVGESRIEGASRLRHKESDRATVLCEMLAEFGVKGECHGDTMVIVGGEISAPATVDSRNDHRIAMAAAVMALSCDSEVVIERAEAVDKSYPLFWRDLEYLKNL